MNKLQSSSLAKSLMSAIVIPQLKVSEEYKAQLYRLCNTPKDVPLEVFLNGIYKAYYVSLMKDMKDKHVYEATSGVLTLKNPQQFFDELADITASVLCYFDSSPSIVGRPKYPTSLGLKKFEIISNESHEISITEVPNIEDEFNISVSTAFSMEDEVSDAFNLDSFTNTDSQNSNPINTFEAPSEINTPTPSTSVVSPTAEWLNAMLMGTGEAEEKIKTSKEVDVGDDNKNKTNTKSQKAEANDKSPEKGKKNRHPSKKRKADDDNDFTAQCSKEKCKKPKKSKSRTNEKTGKDKTKKTGNADVSDDSHDDEEENNLENDEIEMIIEGCGIKEFLKHVKKCDKKNEALQYEDIILRATKTIALAHAYWAEYAKKSQSMLSNFPFTVNKRGEITEVKLECNLCPLHCTNDMNMTPPRGRPQKEGVYEEMHRKNKKQLKKTESS